MWVRTCQGLDFVVDDDTFSLDPIDFQCMFKKTFVQPIWHLLICSN